MQVRRARQRQLVMTGGSIRRRERFGERAGGTLSGRAETALAAKSLETVHLVHEYCGRALDGEDGNGRTGD